MKAENWPFKDPENVAVYTIRQIISGEKWIYYVSHDADDGAWQFHDKDPATPNESDARIVSLERIVEIDPRLKELADLPLGWHAWRESPTSEWKRAPQKRD